MRRFVTRAALQIINLLLFACLPAWLPAWLVGWLGCAPIMAASTVGN
jgi:hypothetical protein